MRLGIKVKKDKEELHGRIIMSFSTVNSSKKKKDATFDIKRQTSARSLKYHDQL